MNKQRRKSINDRIEELENIKSQMESIAEAIEEIRCDEEEAYDALPESIHESERGDTMQECIEGLSESYDMFDDIYSNIDDIIDRLKEVVEC